jgi:uncharacterized protein (DUF362 family)
MGALLGAIGLLTERARVDEVIVDLNEVLQPDLGIIDASVGQTDVGSGRLIPLGTVVCGRNPVSVDSVMAQVMQFNPADARAHLALAEEQGLQPQPRGDRGVHR